MFYESSDQSGHVEMIKKKKKKKKKIFTMRNDFDQIWKFCILFLLLLATK